MSSERPLMEEQQANEASDGLLSMTAAGVVHDTVCDAAKLDASTIEQGLKGEIITQDSMETGPTSSVELAQRLQQMTVSPERKRDETPPSERLNDDLFVKLDNNNNDQSKIVMRQTESPTIGASSVSVGLQQTPNSNNRHRETPPKRRSPASMIGAVPTPRHFDLTPVTRNTSNADAYMDDYSDDEDYFVITPDDTAVLHGEHLALPSDLSELNFGLSGSSSIPKQLPERRSVAPPLPPLRACNKQQRTKSVGTLDSVIQTACYHTQMEDATGVENFDYSNEMMNPIDFPERQVYSFTSRKQFEQQHRKQLTPEMMVASSSAASTRGLTPYQPSRDDFQDVGALPEEELDRIFTTRKRDNMTEINSSELSNSALYATIPLEERQWSIPSIRLAHHLNESTTSNTECTDEEDDLRLDEDDESLTSRGSSLYLPDEAALMGESDPVLRHAPPRIVPMLPNSFQPILTGPAFAVLDNGHFLEQASQFNQEDADDSNEGVDRRARHRRKKRSKKERSAVEWLRTVEASDDVFAEAASSKFLMGASLPFRSCGATQQLITATASPGRLQSPIVPSEAVYEYIPTSVDAPSATSA